MSESKVPALLFFLIGNYFFTFLIIGFLAAGISLLNKPKPLRINTVAEAFFSYYLLFAIGINNLVNFVFHVFFGDIAAQFIGWENSPFQAEVGFASLGVGIAGVIAFKASLPFRFATLIPPAVFSLGAGGGHIYQMIVAQNFHRETSDWSSRVIFSFLLPDSYFWDCRINTRNQERRITN
jgi:hypothetical protein